MLCKNNWMLLPKIGKIVALIIKEIIINNVNVGKNFQDHLGIDYLFKTFHPTLNSSLGVWPGRLREMLKYILYRKLGGNWHFISCRF